MPRAPDNLVKKTTSLSEKDFEIKEESDEPAKAAAAEQPALGPTVESIADYSYAEPPAKDDDDDDDTELIRHQDSNEHLAAILAAQVKQ